MHTRGFHRQAQNRESDSLNTQTRPDLEMFSSLFFSHKYPTTHIITARAKASAPRLTERARKLKVY